MRSPSQHLVNESEHPLPARSFLWRSCRSCHSCSSTRAQDVQGAPLFTSITLLSSGPAAVPGDLQVVARVTDLASHHTPAGDLGREAADRANGWTPPSPEVHEFLRHRFTSDNPHALSAKAEILVEIEDAVDVLADLAATAGLPTLVAYGENDDRWSPAEQEQMAYRLGARRLRWPNAAHSPTPSNRKCLCGGSRGLLADVSSTTARSLEFPEGRRGYTHGMELRSPVPSTPGQSARHGEPSSDNLRAWGIDDVIDDMQIVVTSSSPMLFGTARIPLNSASASADRSYALRSSTQIRLIFRFLGKQPIANRRAGNALIDALAAEVGR